MRTFYLPAGLIALASCIAPAWAADQQPQPTTAPAAQSADETNEPGVTIKPPESQTEITERRAGGQVRDIRVKKGNNPPYYLRPVPNHGTQSPQTSPPQWIVKEYGPGSKPTKAPAPPAPTVNENASGNK
jgi:hypothetical protein